MLLSLCLSLLFLACSSKKDTPAPDAATAVAGNYTLSRVAGYENDSTLYDILLPQTNGTNKRSGILFVTRSSATSVEIGVVQQLQQVSGVSSQTTTFGKMDVLNTAPDGSYELYQFNKKSGKANGNTISIAISDTYYAPSLITTRYVLEGKR